MPLRPGDRRRQCLVGALAAALVLLSLPSPAAAWTDARARSARVVLEVVPDGRARVWFDVDVRVRGGWLEGFEVSGLDPDAKLDVLKPPTWTAASGEKWLPRSRMRKGGRLRVALDRRGAPKRGEHRLAFGYESSLAHRATEPRPGGLTRFTWHFPAWETGLEDVEVWVWAPGRKVTAVDGAGLAAGDRRLAGDRSLLRFRRQHLPRATRWPIVFDVPTKDLEGALSEPQSAAAAAVPGGRAAPIAAPSQSVDGSAWWWACALWWAAAWGVGGARRDARQRGVRLGYLLGSAWAAIAASAALFAVAASLTSGLQSLALGAGVLASTWWSRAPSRPLPFGRWQRLTKADLAAAKGAEVRAWIGLEAIADPLSVFGAVACVGPLVFALWHLGAQPSEWLSWGIALVVLWFGQGRWRLRGGSRRDLRGVFAVAASWQGSGVALACKGFVGGAGASIAQPRLCIVPQARVSGLSRMEVAVDSRRGAQGLTVMALVQLDGAADAWLASLGGERRVSPGAHRACHLFAVPDAEAARMQVNGIIAHCGAQAARVAAASLPVVAA